MSVFAKVHWLVEEVEAHYLEAVEVEVLLTDWEVEALGSDLEKE